MRKNRNLGIFYLIVFIEVKLRITNFDVFDENGNVLLADAQGNNIAFNCFECGHPVIAIARDNQKGSDELHPAECKGENCSASFVLQINTNMKKMSIHKINPKT